MANESIRAAFEREHQHIVVALSTKAETEHEHDIITDSEVDALWQEAELGDVDISTVEDRFEGGVLKIENGGTGASSIEDAKANLGISNRNFVDIKTKMFSQVDENFNTTDSGITEYPQSPGVYKVISPEVFGLPNDITGNGSLVIFDCGGYILHFYVDEDSELYTARTEGKIPISGWKKATTTSVGIWNAPTGTSTND